MNQILLQVLSQDPLKTPGIYLSFRWLLPLAPHLEAVGAWFIVPLLGTGLGYLFLDIDDLWDQTFSLTGAVYVGTLMSMIPKPQTSSKLWLSANLFTIIYYVLYFGEIILVARLNLNLEYSVSWLLSIALSTVGAFLLYAILLSFGLSSLHYFKTIVRIYLLTDLGVLLALGAFSPFYSSRLFLFMGALILAYALFSYQHGQRDKNLTILRCLLWGSLSVWADCYTVTPFYALEALLASENQQQMKRLGFDQCKELWKQYKIKLWKNIRKTGTIPFSSNAL